VPLRHAGVAREIFSIIFNLFRKKSTFAPITIKPGYFQLVDL